MRTAFESPTSIEYQPPRPRDLYMCSASRISRESTQRHVVLVAFLFKNLLGDHIACAEQDASCETLRDERTSKECSAV
jgi:hypothetical protein